MFSQGEMVWLLCNCGADGGWSFVRHRSQLWLTPLLHVGHDPRSLRETARWPTGRIWAKSWEVELTARFTWCFFPSFHADSVSPGCGPWSGHFQMSSNDRWLFVICLH